MGLHPTISVSCIVYPLKDKLSFVGEKSVSLLLGSLRTTNNSAAIADSRFGAQCAYYALDGAFAAVFPPVSCVRNIEAKRQLFVT